MANNVSGSFTIANCGLYVARFFVTYCLGRKRYTRFSGVFPIFQTRRIDVPRGATNINIKVEYFNAFQYVCLFNRDYTVPANRCYVLRGFTYKAIINSQECPPGCAKGDCLNDFNINNSLF